MDSTVKMVEIGSVQNDHFQAMSTPGFEPGSGLDLSSYFMQFNRLRTFYEIPFFKSMILIQLAICSINLQCAAWHGRDGGISYCRAIILR